MIDPNHVLRVGAATDLYVEQLQAKVAELEAEVERLSVAHVKACQANADSQAELATAEQRVAEAIVDMLQQKHRNCFGAHSFYLAASVATANGEWRKFVKEV